MFAEVLVAALVLAAPKGAHAPAVAAATSVAAQRVPSISRLTITDENARGVFPLRVAANLPTWILLPAPLKELPKARPELGVPDVTGNLVIITPPADLPVLARVPLILSLSDGPPLVFEVFTVPDAYDQRIEVERRLHAVAAPDSPQVLLAKLDVCQQEREELKSGVRTPEVLAKVLLEQNVQSGKVPPLVRREIGKTEKQNFVLVQVLYSYRLFDWTFVVLSVQNREENTVWSLKDIVVRQMGASAPIPAPSVQTTRPKGIKAAEVAAVIVGFATPADNTRRYALTLTDAAGSRNVTLEGLDL